MQLSTCSIIIFLCPRGGITGISYWLMVLRKRIMGLPEGERTSMIYLAISHNTEMFQGQGWTYKHVAATISSYAVHCFACRRLIKSISTHTIHQKLSPPPLPQATHSGRLQITTMFISLSSTTNTNTRMLISHKLSNDSRSQ